MLWKKPYVAMILEGRKTATRRRARPMVRVGRAYKIRVGFFDSLPHRILVENIRKQRLSDMTGADAAREGAQSLSEFRDDWRSIYGGWDPSEEVWVVEFKLLPDPAARGEKPRSGPEKGHQKV
jgi:hypothetical protein